MAIPVRQSKKSMWLITVGFIATAFIAYAIFWAVPQYERQKHLAEGWVATTGWNCPAGHPTKANLRSMIYHVPGDPYWNETDAMNGECFDTTEHAEQHGFRASRGTPDIFTASAISNQPYKGGYAPDGTYCDFGFNPRTSSCCDDDDYSCEVRDMAPKGATALCVDGTYALSQDPAYDCSKHGGVETDPQYSPFVQ